MGFSPDVCREALMRFHGNVQRAIDHLLVNGGVLLSTSDRGYVLLVL